MGITTTKSNDQVPFSIQTNIKQVSDAIKEYPNVIRASI